MSTLFWKIFVSTCAVMCACAVFGVIFFIFVRAWDYFEWKLNIMNKRIKSQNVHPYEGNFNVMDKKEKYK